MHRIGKIHRRCATWQTPDIAFGREHIYLVRKQIDLDALQKFFRVTSMHIHQMLNPGPGPVMPCAVVIGFTCLVLPVCSHTGYSRLLHGFSTQLHFYRHAVRAEQGGV